MICIRSNCQIDPGMEDSSYFLSLASEHKPQMWTLFYKRMQIVGRNHIRDNLTRPRTAFNKISFFF